MLEQPKANDNHAIFQHLADACDQTATYADMLPFTHLYGHIAHTDDHQSDVTKAGMHTSFKVVHR